MASIRASPVCASSRMQATIRAHPLRPQRLVKHMHPQHRPLASTSGAGAAGDKKSGSTGGVAGFLTKTLGENEYSMQFRLRRWFLFSGLVLGYSFYYLCRNSLNYVNPVMVADKSLGLGMTEVAAMTSIFPIAYGASKFVSGVLGARTSPRLLLAIGLMCTASVNILFGFSSSLVWFCVLWAINGTLQGFGGPSCARMLTTWFASKERGTYWGLWNIAHNLGGFLAPIIAGFAAREFGWRWGMWVPGIMGIVMGFYVLLSTADSPESKGYPPVEVLDEEDEKSKDEGKDAGEKAEKPSMISVLITTVLKNPYIWGMALTYFFIYVIRQGVTSWSVFYLLKVKGVANAAQAAFMVSGLEVGGLAGSLLAGRIADAMVNNAKDPINEGNVGKRVQVVMAYTVGIAACLAAFQLAPAGVWALQWAIVFMLGFFIYGPQMLIGLCGAELVGPESVGASEGFLGWVAYLGAANAGIPLSIIVKQYGWSAYFSTLIGACIGALILLSPMVNLKSHVQREKARLAARDKKTGDVAPPTEGKPEQGEGPAPAAA